MRARREIGRYHKGGAFAESVELAQGSNSMKKKLKRPNDTRSHKTPKPKPFTLQHDDVVPFCVLFADILAQQISEADVEGAFWTAWARWASPDEVARAKQLTRARNWD
jgi:hypothetical protein